MSSRLADILEHVKELTSEERKIAMDELDRQQSLSDKEREEALAQLREDMSRGLYHTLIPYKREELYDRFSG